MRTFTSNVRFVYHLEEDVLDGNKIVYSDIHSIMLTDGIETETIVGEATSSGYVEGTGTAARFSWITQFVQINETTVIAADYGNHCLRFVDRQTRSSSVFVGSCTVAGFIDGTQARFSYPRGVIQDVRLPFMILVLEQGNGVIREVNTITSETTTWVGMSAGLTTPMRVAFDFVGKNLLITDSNHIKEYDIDRQNSSIFTGGGSGSFSDGTLSEAKFNNPRAIIPLSESITLVADNFNQRIRIVNTETDTVTSICTGSAGSSNGDTSQCTLNGPYGLLVKDGYVFIGQTQAIRMIPCEYLI